MMLKKLLVISLMVILTISIFSATSHLTILHVNDTHGHAWQFGEYHNPDIGGFAAVSTIVDAIKEEIESCGGDVLVLHAGDYNTGVPESDQLDAVPDIVAMNMVGFDAVVLGNHEFDKERDVLKRQMELIDFPVLSANILNEKGERPVQPYEIFDFDDLSVAVYGLTTRKTEYLEPIYLDNWYFENVVETSEKFLPELNQKADVVVALAHLGYGPGDDSEYNTSDDLANAFDNLDVIVDGHSHTLFEEPPYLNETILVQAGDWNKYVGRLDLTIVDGEVVDYSWEAIPVNVKNYLGDGEYEYVGEPVERDPKVKAALDYFMKLGDEKLNEVVGKTEEFLSAKDVRSGGTNLSNLITDAMLWKTDADIALQNSGGIRASIQPGGITYRDILTVLPFGNTVYLFELTGNELLDVLDYAVTADSGAYPQFAGVDLVSEDGEIQKLFIDGRPVDGDKTYRLVTNNYLAFGGDGYNVLSERTEKGYDTGFVLADVVKDYIAHLGTIEEYTDEARYIRK